MATGGPGDDEVLYSRTLLTNTKGTFPPGVVVAAAIDLGTTLSGYAFAFKDNPTRIYASTWSSNTTDPILSHKTPTTVLLDKDARFQAFGLDAEERYAQLCEENLHQDWYYFQNFKMELYRQKSLTKRTVLKDINGKELPALDIFTMTIRFLKESLFDQARLSKTSLEKHDIMWVITVPAIWSDAAKQFMTIAANQAGIDTFQLRLVLEPEAASLYCQANYTRRDLQAGELVELTHFPAGHKYTVGDLGGGTGDFATHEVLPDGTLTEISRSSGGEFGGNRVNVAFLRTLEILLKQETLGTFKSQFRHDYLQLVRDFEVKKRTVSTDEQATITVRIPYTLTECIEVIHGEGVTLKKLIYQEGYQKMLEVKRDKLVIKANLVKVFFNEPVDEIVKTIKQIIQTERFQINSLLLVGGFADSPYVKETITREIQRDCPGVDACKPEEAGLHVLKGAVLNLLHPNHISERVSRYSYGFRVAVPFNEREHPPNLKERRQSGEEYCADVFYKCIEIDQKLKCGQKLNCIFSAIKQSQASKTDVCCTELYRSKQHNPKYCTKEEGCKRVGKFVHHPPVGGWGNIVMFNAEIVVGETQLKVTVIDATTQEVYETTIDFLDDFENEAT